MRSQDITALVAMESRSNAHPWPESALQHSHDAGHRCIVCQTSLRPEPVAYAVSSRVLDECSLLNICVCLDYQGQGIGRAMMTEFIRSERQLGTGKIFLEVRESNNRAIALYESLGFICEHIRKEYYPGKHQRENAWVYSLELTPAV